MNLKDIKNRVEDMRAKYNQDLGSFQALSDTRDALTKEIAEKELEQGKLEEAKLLLIETAREARENARLQLEEITTAALQYVFGPDYKFEIEIKDTARGVAAEFYVISDLGEREDPMSARGGGVVDIIAIALQLAIVQIHKDPVIRGPILLDEPGKHVSEDYAVKLAMFLEEMSKQFDRQIIMVTHQAHLAQIADNAIQVDIKKGTSLVSSI